MIAHIRQTRPVRFPECLRHDALGRGWWSWPVTCVCCHRMVRIPARHATEEELTRCVSNCVCHCQTSAMPLPNLCHSGHQNVSPRAEDEEEGS